MTRLILPLLLAGCALVLPTAAQASKLTLNNYEADDGLYSVINYDAAPGKANRLALTLSPTEVIARDTADPVKPGRGCKAISRVAVRCPVQDDLLDVTVKTGDKNDVVRVRGRLRAPVMADDAYIHLGAGNDVAVGDTAHEFFEGGPGNDILSGRGGPDELEGGAGDDVLTGGAGEDVFHCGPGSDRVTDAQTGELGEACEGGPGGL
jgi:RTX calcium-binding nonapeptide repeat (4 copies)